MIHYPAMAGAPREEAKLRKSVHLCHYSQTRKLGRRAAKPEKWLSFAFTRFQAFWGLNEAEARLIYPRA